MSGDVLALSVRFVNGHLPGVSTAILAGSQISGAVHPASDFDIVALYESLPAGAWRGMFHFEGADFEVFAHDLATLRYFVQEIEGPSARPALAHMVLTGQDVMTCDPQLLREARVIAKSLLDAGPPALSLEAIDSRRYTITELALSLRMKREPEQQIAVGSELYARLTDLQLRASGNWSASGKQIPSALRAQTSEIERSFTKAFSELFQTGDDAAVQKLVDRVLSPHGGKLRAGFRQTAPCAWRRPPLLGE